jgi:RNA recognition motif-containing protein
LKASTNLYISTTRLQLRNLPRREFFEPEMKSLMNVVAEEWAKNLDKETYVKQYKNKKLISHVKVMRDGEKTDDNGAELPSGQGFVEFTNADLALFAVRYLNNLEIAARRGLIVDFSMEDQRQLFKRKEKIERWREIAKEKKANEEPAEKPAYVDKSKPLDLGAKNQPAEPVEKVSRKAKKNNCNIKDVEDVGALKDMLK